MPKLFLIIAVLPILLWNCNDDRITGKGRVASTVQKRDTTKFNGLQGTWVRQNSAGFTLIEIKDTSNVLYYQFLDRAVDLHKSTEDPFWYYKSKAKMGYWNNSAIWIATDKFRFDYKLNADTLIEFDKMGEQGKFVKVFTDEEKTLRRDEH